MQIDSQLVRKLAHLSRIQLSDSEVETFSHQLTSIADFVGTLSEVAGASDLRVRQISGLSNVWSADLPETSIAPDDIIRAFPERDDRTLSVPPIL